VSLVFGKGFHKTLAKIPATVIVPILTLDWLCLPIKGDATHVCLVLFVLRHQRKHQSKNSEVAVLTMVLFGDVTYTGLVPFVLHHPINQSRNSKVAVLIVVSFGDATHIGRIGFICVKSPKESK
jgi:hypothetical protein